MWAVGKLIVTYVAILREVLQHCEFKKPLSDMLQDRLVCGMNHKGLMNQLLAEKDLIFNKALKLVQAMESAE